jgi:CheY-like chemotaxis protein
MLSNKPRFRVAVAGLDLRDVRLIEIVFKHSQYNRYEFVLVNHVAVGEVDLLIANAHDSDGNAAINALRQSQVHIPVIAAVPRGESSSSKHAISIDRLTLQLLPIMNRVVELDLLSPETVPMDATARASMAAAERQARLNVPQFDPVGMNAPRSNPVAQAPQVNQTKEVPRFNQPVKPQLSEQLAARTQEMQEARRLAEEKFRQTQAAQIQQQAQLAEQIKQRTSVSSPTANASPKPNLVAFPGAKKAGEALRVLVVDDSPTVRQQLGGALEKMGFIVELAATGTEALKRLDGNHFDLALVDVIMPEMDGYKLTREIKKDKKRKSMPVIILTSKSSPFDLARGALAGCDSFLTKPVPLKALQDAIIKHLRKSLAIDDLSSLLNLDPNKPAAPKQPQALRESNPVASSASH